MGSASLEISNPASAASGANKYGADTMFEGHSKFRFLSAARAFAATGAISAALLGALAAPSSAHAALISQHSSAVCHAAEGVHQQDLVRGWNSIQNSGSVPLYLVCPLSRNSAGTTGGTIYVTVSSDSVVSFGCSAVSVSATGIQLASATATSEAAGTRQFALDLTGTGKSSPGSHYAVWCLLPVYGAGGHPTVNSLVLVE